MSTISDLFATDPLRLTRTERAEIIAKMRENRASFMAGQRTEKLSKPKAEPKAKGPKITGLDLGDLDI